MNYDRIIIELLDRISKLEEKVDDLDKKLSNKRDYVSSSSTEGISKVRDKTKYIFDGYLCLKNRLVQEVVKKYVSEHQQITFDELKNIFCDKVQGSFGIVRKKDDIEPQKENRYFFKEEDTIYLADNSSVVVSNQWDKDNIKAFIVLARSLGYEIEEA